MSGSHSDSIEGLMHPLGIDLCSNNKLVSYLRAQLQKLTAPVPMQERQTSHLGRARIKLMM